METWWNDTSNPTFFLDPQKPPVPFRTNILARLTANRPMMSWGEKGEEGGLKMKRGEGKKGGRRKRGREGRDERKGKRGKRRYKMPENRSS